jgi:hypothetical protein
MQKKDIGEWSEETPKRKKGKCCENTMQGAQKVQETERKKEWIKRWNGNVEKKQGRTKRTERD